MIRMDARNLPALDARYWVAIFVASLLGTTLGDFISTTLHLGFVRGLVPLCVVLAVIFAFERRATEPSEAYYWAAIVITRTMATNIADLFTHALKLDYREVAAVFALLLVATLLLGQRKPFRLGRLRSAALPNADSRYWLAILFASILGTTLGDFVSDGLGLGLLRGGILLAIVLCAVLYCQSRVVFFCSGFYWLAIVAVRTSGTVLGDFLSSSEGVNLGFGLSAATMALLLVGVLRFWRRDAISVTLAEPLTRPD
jgi:uncharacterized membrane-anchored protein